MDTKQVIILRKFPNLRIGKYASQCSHASMAFLTKGVNHWDYDEEHEWGNLILYGHVNMDEIDHWLNHSFKKIVCYVNTEEELVAIHEKALGKGLISHLIEDNGATEFGGVKTKTAVGIGPHEVSKFEGLTDHLPLL